MSGSLTKKVDETHGLSKRKGGGRLRIEVWVDAAGQVARFNLAYVNHALCQRDNGSVLGYDSAHGTWHRHYYGRVTAIKAKSFDQIEAAFEKEWLGLSKRIEHE